jgi:hypothetical protein
MFTYTKLHMAVIECKLVMCISRLVEFELSMELKFEQKKGTSLHTACCKDASRVKTVEHLSVPVILGEFRTLIYSELAWDIVTVGILYYMYNIIPLFD